MEVDSGAPQKPSTRAPLACAGGCKVELPASKLLILLNDEDESCHSQSIFFCFFQNERPTNSVGTKDSVQGTNGNEGYQGSKWSCEELTQQKAWPPMTVNVPRVAILPPRRFEAMSLGRCAISSRR